MNTIPIIAIRTISAAGLLDASIERFSAMKVGPNEIANKI
jgi:hypothetical protein